MFRVYLGWVIFGFWSSFMDRNTANYGEYQNNTAVIAVPHGIPCPLVKYVYTLKVFD